MKNKNNTWTEKDKIVKLTPFTENKTDYVAGFKNKVYFLVT